MNGRPSKKGSPPFVLPEAPADGHRVEWYTVRFAERVIHHACVYHVRTPWQTLYPNGSTGTDLVNQWQIFQDGTWVGRSLNGWHAIVIRGRDWRETYATRAEAEAALLATLETKYLKLCRDRETVLRQIAAFGGSDDKVLIWASQAPGDQAFFWSMSRCDYTNNVEQAGVYARSSVKLENPNDVLVPLALARRLARPVVKKSILTSEMMDKSDRSKKS